jgi:hypothetical protein
MLIYPVTVFCFDNTLPLVDGQLMDMIAIKFLNVDAG